MSAFVVDPAHIDYMVSAAVIWRRDCISYGIQRVAPEHADWMGADLLAENIASVSYRYPDCALDDLPGPIPTPAAINYRHHLTVTINPLWVLKAISCYEYQSCEHPAWEESAAKKFCDELRDAAISHLPGYDAAPWEITREHARGNTIALF